MIRPTPRLSATLLAVGLLAGGTGLGWTMADDGQAETSLVAPRETWREPRTSAGDPAATLQGLAQHPLWRAPSKPPPAAPTQPDLPPSWRLSGILRGDGSPQAIILLTSGGRSRAQVQYRGVGDLLPDGSRIIEISNTAITVESGDTQHSVRLFSRE